MATIRREFTVRASAAAVWDALLDYGAVHERLAAGFVTACTLEDGGAVRALTFANGMQARERLVGVDVDARRLAYASEGGRASHHNASAQVAPIDDASCRFIWITDVLPDALAGPIGAMMDAGAVAMQATLERNAAAGAG